jgi:hypothetical protein
VIVRTSSASMARVAERLSQDGVAASFAMTGVPASPAIRELRKFGDAPMCEITPARALRWVETRSQLRREARALSLQHRFYYFAPQGSLTVGQILSARTADARRVVGSVQLSSTSPVPSRPLRAGDIVVITLTGSATSIASVDRFAAELGAEHLHGVPFSTLTG